jgi:hypothetical protein
MLGFEVAQSDGLEIHGAGWAAVAGLETFFRNHAQTIAAIDLFVVPTLNL